VGAELLPPIRRARAFRLYAADGRRYLDLWLDGGHAILGHGAGPAMSAARNTLAAGLLPPLPSVHAERFARALARRFPSHPCVRLYATRARALQAAARALGTAGEALQPFDPAIDPLPGSPPRAALWRPWTGDGARAAAESAGVLLPVIPFAVAEAPAVLCCRGEPGAVPDSDDLPGFLLAAAVRGLECLSQAPPRNPLLAGLEAVLDACGLWQRRGRYARPLCDPGERPGVHARFLEAGVLLPPACAGPAILPAELSAGEAALLARLFRTPHGG
jgi:hypothetical protein